MTSSGTLVAIKPIVYRVDNLVNGKFYIGVASGGVLKRRREHLYAARHCTDKGRSKFYNAIRKYGEGNFSFAVLEQFESYGDALAREVELIAALAPAYNITSGGQGVVGFKMPREIVERLAAGKRGVPGYWLGKKRDPETVAKIAKSQRGKPKPTLAGKARSEETKRKISTAKLGKPRKTPPPHALSVFAENMRRAARARRKPVVCENDGRRYESCRDASAAYGLHSESVASVASGRRKQANGMSFKYVEASLG